MFKSDRISFRKIAGELSGLHQIPFVYSIYRQIRPCTELCVLIAVTAIRFHNSQFHRRNDMNKLSPVGLALARQTTEQNVRIRHHRFHVDLFVLFMRIVQTVAIKAAAYITPDRQHANANFSVDIIINYARYN